MHELTEKLLGEIRASVGGATERELSFSPAAGTWSAGQVLEHLQRTYTGTSKGLERALQAGKPLVTPLPGKMRFFQLAVLTMGWFPRGRKSPKQAEPRGEIAVMELPQSIEAKLAEMDGLLSQAEQRWGGGKVLDHPVLGALTAEQWRKFHLVHGKHHVRQVRERRVLAGGV